MVGKSICSSTIAIVIEVVIDASRSITLFPRGRIGVLTLFAIFWIRKVFVSLDQFGSERFSHLWASLWVRTQKVFVSLPSSPAKKSDTSLSTHDVEVDGEALLTPETGTLQQINIT